MDISTYIKESAKTEAKKMYMENVSRDLLYGVIGICTEATELLAADTSVNVKEELGDIMWYIAVAMRAEKIDPIKLQNDAAHANIHSGWLNRYSDWPLGAIVILAGELLDYLKKVLFYNVPMNQIRLKLYTSLTLIYAGIMAMSIENKWDIEDILDSNIAKSKELYPEKFNDKNNRRS